MTDFESSEITDIVYIRIDTKIRSAAGIQSELRKVMQYMYVTLSSKVNRRGYVNLFNICGILDLKNVIIDTTVEFI